MSASQCDTGCECLIGFHCSLSLIQVAYWALHKRDTALLQTSSALQASTGPGDYKKIFSFCDFCDLSVSDFCGVHIGPARA